MALFQVITLKEDTIRREIYLRSPQLQVREDDIPEEHELTISNRISHADWLNEHRSAEEQYHHAESQNFRHSQDPELLWRFGRACHCVYSYSTVATKEVKAAAIQDGLRAVEKAVQIDPQNANAFVVMALQ